MERFPSPNSTRIVQNSLGNADACLPLLWNRVPHSVDSKAVHYISLIVHRANLSQPQKCSLVVFTSLSTVFPWFLPTDTINFSACEDAGTIRGREQNKDGVNITRLRMLSRVLARVHSVWHEVLVAASNECSCLSRDLYCGVSCHPLRLCDVSTFAPGAPPTSCEFHYCAGTIRGWD